MSRGQKLLYIPNKNKNKSYIFLGRASQQETHYLGRIKFA
jgi:hypothetical protein